MPDENLNPSFAALRRAIGEKLDRTDPARLWRRLLDRLRADDLARLRARLAGFEKNPARLTLSDRKDLILLLLYAPGRTGAPAEPVFGMTRIMKLVFLFLQELGARLPLKNPYRFAPYKLGPFAPELYSDLETLLDAGLVRAETLDPEGVPVLAADFRTATTLARLNSGIKSAERLDSLTIAFSLTPRGRRFARALYAWLARRQKNTAAGLWIIKAQFGALPLNTLLRYIYTRYPEYTTRSEIVEKLLRRPKP